MFMQRLRTVFVLSGSIGVFNLCAAHAHADLIINSNTNEILDVEYTAGEGENTSYLVVDFGATGGGAFGFAYNWSFSATGLDMLQAIDVGGPLEVQLDDSDFGQFVVNFSFNDDLGDPGAFWAYHTAEPEDIDPGVDWTFSSIGIEDRVLQDGSLDGWYNGFDGIEPDVPTVVIPAPASIGLLGMVFITRRRRRRH